MPPRRSPTESLIYGVAAVRAVVNVRPADILRLVYTEAARREIGGLLRVAAKQGIHAEVVQPRALEALAGSVHHEGVCVVCRLRPEPGLASLVRPAGTVLVLDGVANPHNVGAILRTAAFFGVHGVVILRPERGPLLPPAALRIAEGGAEHVAVAAANDTPSALQTLRNAGMTVVGADPGQGARSDAGGFLWPRACALVLGGERSGLAAPIRALCHHLVTIAPAGERAVESLNVSVAAGILLAFRSRSLGSGVS